MAAGASSLSAQRDAALRGRDTTGARPKAARRIMTTPLLGRLPLKQQVNLLVAVIGISLALALGFGVYDTRSTNMVAAQNEVVGDALMHSQRLAKAAGIAVQGSTLAYDQLQDSVKNLTAAAAALTQGGSIAGQRIEPLADALQPLARNFGKVWGGMAPNVGDVISQEKVLVRFNQLAYQGRIAAGELLATNARAIEAVRRASGSSQELMALTQIELHLRTIVGEMSRLMQTNDIRAEDAATLASHIEGFALARSAALDGSFAQGLQPLRTLEARNLIQQAAPLADAFVRSALDAQQALPALDQARVAGRKVFFGSEKLTDSISGMRAAMTAARAEHATSEWLVVGFASLALLGLLLLGKAYYDDSAAKALEADEQRAEAEGLEQEAKRLNDQNQAAILRLMNELQGVADGDLTVQATVSEDITGAIADSVNYTIEELRDLVGRINRTAAAVAEASGQAQITSSGLQAASDQQSREIRQTGEAVLSMASQIKQVSASASESADVARQSLMAAGRGRDAVQNAIAGMNGIRDQIQETAKRIKRLGESSQEIGEIIELISDITEQTNVLALNAAIQAASAGEAGRGFTIVAEEVQRLAEKSAEATRQISALVKAIQTDTHDAVAAMERSTQGVVQGAKLSDDAGTALSGIGKVSQELADLIMRISRTTQRQAESAESVAQSIQRILLVTEQTSEGTQQTAGSILQLSELAGELKNSVSRFKVE
ncbi:MAG: methyl-accepting chemotaxis protein [Lautropia sp.]|nr:methyl-accepting chemotaxis protein [Lautropia sp.]